MGENEKTTTKQEVVLQPGIYEIDPKNNTIGPIKIKNDQQLESSGSNYC